MRFRWRGRSRPSRRRASAADWITSSYDMPRQIRETSSPARRTALIGRFASRDDDRDGARGGRLEAGARFVLMAGELRTLALLRRRADPPPEGHQPLGGEVERRPLPLAEALDEASLHQ